MKRPRKKTDVTNILVKTNSRKIGWNDHSQKTKRSHTTIRTGYVPKYHTQDQPGGPSQGPPQSLSGREDHMEIDDPEIHIQVEAEDDIRARPSQGVGIISYSA